ncbi:hypothetical protein T484DRAFT_1776455, partial [Baffinella frigidus]
MVVTAGLLWQVVRRHFPYMLDFDRYSAEELVGVFNQQCEKDNVRLGSTVTQVMLSKSFVLNFSFFNGSNGAGKTPPPPLYLTHLLALAKMQAGKRPDSEDLLRGAEKDWFAAHPEKTFSAMQQMQQLQNLRSDVPRDRGLSNAEDGANEAAMVAEDLERGLQEIDEKEESVGRWSIDDFQQFHVNELKRRETEHAQSLQRERDECRLVVDQTQEAHALSLARVFEAIRVTCERRFMSTVGAASFQRWVVGVTLTRRARGIMAAAATTRTSRCLHLWHTVAHARKTRRARLAFILGLRRRREVVLLVAEWGAVARETAADRARRTAGAARFLERRGAEEEALLLEVIDTWQVHAEETALVIKRHQNEVTEWRLDAENSLEPLQNWRRRSIAGSMLLVGAYVGVLIIATIIGALRRSYTWVEGNVDMPLRAHAAATWVWDTGLDAMAIAVAFSLLCWPLACGAPPVAPNDKLVPGLEAALSAAAGEIQGGEGEGPWEACQSFCQRCTAPADPAAPCAWAVEGSGVVVCHARAEWVAKAVVLVAAAVVAQSAKKMGLQLHKQGVQQFIKTSAARMLPSWFYSLYDHSVADMVAVLQDAATPLGKKAKACKRLGALVASDAEMQRVVADWGGITALIAQFAVVPEDHASRELVESAARALAQMCTTLPLAMSAIDKGAIPALAKVLKGAREKPSAEGRAALGALAALAKGGGAGGAEAVVVHHDALRSLVDSLASRDVKTRTEAAVLASNMAHALLHRRHGGHDRSLDTLGLNKALQDRCARILAPTVAPLVAELQGGWWLRVVCTSPESKGCAARALGYLANGSAENVDAMVRLGAVQGSRFTQGVQEVRVDAVQALMRILRFKFTWLLQSTDGLLRLKAEAAFAVAAIAREGDLHRGRLQ